MSGAVSGQREFSIQGRAREEMLASEAGVTKFTIEIQHDTVALLERIVEEMLDLTSTFFEVLAEIFQSVHSLASEDHATLFEFSTGILMVNWIVCNALSPFMKAVLPRSRLFLKLMGLLNIALVDLDGFANHYYGENTTSVVRDETDVGDAGISSFFSSLTDFSFVGTEMLNFISPAVVMIVGPLTVMTLTCIIADNKYHLFATLFAPMVERVVSSTRSFVALVTPNIEGYQYQTIPDDRETYDGVLWRIIVLFFLESLFVGSIVVLMVVISLSLTILASMSTILSSKDHPEMLEETSMILVGFLFSWVACVLTMNVLRMVIYQTVDNDD